MLLMRLSPHLLVGELLRHLGKQVLLLVVVVRLDELVPRERVPDKVGLVGLLDVRRLVPDGVVAADDAVVKHAHVARASREHVGLAGVSPWFADFALSPGLEYVLCVFIRDLYVDVWAGSYDLPSWSRTAAW